MRRRFVGIHRRSEANPVMGCEPDCSIVKSRQIAEYFDKFEADFLRTAQQHGKIGVELRLATDELNFSTTKRKRLVHDRLIVVRSQLVAITTVRVGVRITMNATQVTTVGQFKP